MELDSFSEGIAPGGLRSKNEIKLLVSYLLKKIDMPISRMKICDIIQEYNIANYFEINQAITEMINNDVLLCKENDGVETLLLMGKSYFEIEQVENMIPRTIREKALAAATKIINRERLEKQNNITVEPVKDGYLVTFEVKDDDEILFKMSVFVTDNSQVELVKRNFCDHVVDIYSNVMSALTIE